MKSPATETDILTALGAAVQGAGGLRAFGRKHGLTAGFLSQVFAGKTPPSDRLCQTIGYRKVVRYEPLKTKRSA